MSAYAVVADAECAPATAGQDDGCFQSFVVFVTEACNLRCDYCYLSARPRRMTEATAAAVADFVAEHTVAGKDYSVCFFGGEPLMVPATVAALAEALRDRGNRDGRGVALSMTTNGTLVDAANAALLHRYDIRTKVSLDGIGPAHDRHRKFANGRGSFARLSANLARIRALPGITVRVTVSPDNVGMLASSARWLAEQGFPHVFFSPVVEAQWSADSLAELVDQYEALREVAGRYPQTRLANLERDAERLGQSPQRRYGCGAAVTMAAIDVDGHLYPCHRYVGYFASQATGYRIGSVATGVDQAARRRFVANGRLADRLGCGLGLYEGASAAAGRGCAECLLQPLCHASCMAVNEAMTGDGRRPSPVNRLLAQVSAASCLSAEGARPSS